MLVPWLLGAPGQAQAEALQTCAVGSEFVESLPANSYEISAQIDIDLGRNLVRIG